MNNAVIIKPESSNLTITTLPPACQWIKVSDGEEYYTRHIRVLQPKPWDAAWGM